MPSTGQDAEGMRELQDLLRRPPKELTTFVLSQANELTKAGVDIETLPLFKVVKALKSAPPSDVKQLTGGVLKGFGELDGKGKAQAMRVALNAQQLSKQIGPGSEAPQLKNLAKLMTEVKEVQTKLPPQELQVIMKESQETATAVAATTMASDPASLVEIVSELNTEERAQLKGVLDESGMVPEEKRHLVEAALEPGGYADKFATITVWAAWFMENKHLILALPGGEFVLAFIFGFGTCNVPLISWLQTDSLLGFGACAAAYFASLRFAPVLIQVKSDPMGAFGRFSAAASSPLREKCLAAVPGVPFESYHPMGTLCLAALGLALVLGEVWAVFGILELVAAPLLGCSGAIWLIGLFFVCLRAAALLGMLYAAFWVLMHSGLPMPPGLKERVEAALPPGMAGRLAPGQTQQDVENRGAYHQQPNPMPHQFG